MEYNTNKEIREIKLNGESMNIIEDNIEKLKTIFPEVFTENKIDFEKLQAVLGNYIETENERYNFTWNGKQKALRLAQTPSTGTLRPCKEESKNWDSTKNLYIEGDNLEVLKLLQKSYHNKIKMIYIDPPYNTNEDYIYPDDYKDNLQNYKKITKQIDEDGNPISTNQDRIGRYHTNWLNLIYPRLRLARNLLKETGVIVIHIDEHEVYNLIKIANEIFGEDNSLGFITWDKKNPKGDATAIAVQHEYLLVYAKNKSEIKDKSELVKPKKNAAKILNKAKQLYNCIGKKLIPNDLKEIIKKYNLPDTLGNQYKKEYTLEDANIDLKEWIKKQDFSDGEAAYSQIDENGDVYQTVSMSWPNKKKAPDDYFIPLIHPITNKACPVPDKGWRNPPKTMNELLENELIIFGKDETTQPRRKYLLKENMFENIPSILSFGGSDEELLKELNIPFDNPKPHKFAKDLISYFVKDKDDVVLDFFAGSATTAHSIMQLNFEQNSNLKYILIQFPEFTFDLIEGNEKPKINAKKAYDAGYKNICEIGKERIRRAGEKIKEELKTQNQQLKLGEEPKKLPDIGFKVFKLDTSNIKKWNGNAGNIEEELQASIWNYVDGRAELDIVYEIMLKCGLDLTYKTEEIKITDKTLYSIGSGAMFVCMDNNITQDVADKIVEIKDKNEIEEPVVVFRDNGFKDDSTKTNIKETLRTAQIKDFITV